jgi:hypothetical protein
LKVGDYVARITNKWQQHNPWMEFPADKQPVPLGIIVSGGHVAFSWDVLESSGKIVTWHYQALKAISMELVSDNRAKDS